MFESGSYTTTLKIDSRTALEGELDRIVNEAVQHAVARPGHGILVTRHAFGTFTVELSNEVPQGTIAELDITSRLRSDIIKSGQT